jgi:SagB-type dehydrogenase family enzyme
MPKPPQSLILDYKPAPDSSGMTLEQSLRQRRSTRDYTGEPITQAELARLLWAATGFTSPGGLRTAPSAGAIYPLHGYLVAMNVEGLAAGCYGWDAESCRLTLMRKGDPRARLLLATGGQSCVESCACAFLLAAWFGSLTREFGALAPRLTDIEAGHIGQNWLLEATSLGLGAVGLARLDGAGLRALIPLPKDEEPLYLLLAGRR